MGISNERGAVVVLVAVMLFLIFFCVALVVDIGHIHNVKIELQRAVDAAALAGAQEIPAGSPAVVTTAVAMGSANKVDNDAVTIKPENVVLGRWKTEIINGESASDRFAAGGTSINAVKVTAILDVPHFFFFPVDDTTVTADAIAMVEPINPVLPLAMVSCTLTGESWRLPDMTIAGITSFEFAANDTGAWTSLTIPPANAATINDLIVDPDKTQEFNSIIYGYSPDPNANTDRDGIENTAVDPGVYPYNSNYNGCISEGTDISCGLGQIAGFEIASPEDFPVPLNLSDLVFSMVDGKEVYEATSFDPLTDFGRKKDASGTPIIPLEGGALPRWYNLNDVVGLQKEDYFGRILTQDGILLNTGKLEDYYNGVEKPFPVGSGDDRFRPSKSVATGGDLILCDSKGCRPNYAKILRRAGYPQVYLTNGVSTVLIQNFLEKVGAQNGTMSCRADDALPDNQHALILKAPVIYVGACDDWAANPSQKYSYVGMTKFLVTRIWVNNTGYDCPGSEDLQAENEPGPLRIEGLQILPVADGQDDQASLPRYYLVE